MKRLIIALLVIGGTFGAGLASANDAEIGKRTAESRKVVKAFMGQLLNELQGAMKKGGPVNAIGVCNTKAPKIAADASKQHGWDVGRTSLKLRNSKNKPDKWEKKVLKEFEARKAKGEDPTKIEHAEIITAKGKTSFRYMKAIPTGDACLTCHGTKIDDKVAAKLDELYPKDKARGFNKGDLRGAFSITQPM